MHISFFCFNLFGIFSAIITCLGLPKCSTIDHTLIFTLNLFSQGIDVILLCFRIFSILHLMQHLIIPSKNFNECSVIFDFAPA